MLSTPPPSPSFPFSPIALGLWRLQEWNMDLPQLQAYIEEALTLGVTTFDHADIYGDYSCEALFGRLLKEQPQLRQHMQLVSKCGIMLLSGKYPHRRVKHYDTSYGHITGSVEQSLRCLQTDYLDLLLIHRPDPLMDPAEVARAFADLQQAGKVRSFGVSNFSPRQYQMLKPSHGRAAGDQPGRALPFLPGPSEWQYGLLSAGGHPAHGLVAPGRRPAYAGPGGRL
ncbi:aldo/keto reductase [Cesiribacter andamanensis]|uniref:Oxidoreductase YdhF n=1 Tax=Cesiribacter andamanensis AMV16 TaxID=1279009 RepID=M7NJF8_9BACT|nr:aldo/keto reductase [Cesiribacter andamanensis]EMR01925.1 Oxidoreductase YdhF [Cesiribacter andamanensis AMV16]